MADEKDPGPGTTGDVAKAAEPGTVSRLLLEIARASEEGLAASWREPLDPGDVIGRYQIRREIGRGGFGAVYEAFDPQLGRTVALKALKPGRSKHPVSEEWIQKEAEAVAKLDHPAIVTIHDVGTCPAGAYLVMELLRGETLGRRIEQGPLSVDEALRIAEQMAEGLAHAHSRGVLHRDLKPANVFVCDDGRVKLLDFGLAHLLGTEGSSGAGTPAYMAPEQAAGAVIDERADVWAAGMVLGEMLTGKRPVERTPTPVAETDRTELMWEAAKERVSPGTPPALARVPRPVAKAVGAALSEDPAARARDGGSWLTELRSARRRVERPKRIRRIAIFATAFVLVGLAVAGFATWRVWERQIPGGRPTVAVADFTNETGEQELDGISGLLITSLEQGTQLRVVTRGRMLDVLKQLGREKVDRIDEPLARDVGREVRATALLLASVRRLGDSYVVEMRALDPLHDEYLFTVSDRASRKEAVFDLVDRLGEATRRRLGAEGKEAPAMTRIAAITTANPKAWDLFFRAVQARDQVRREDALGLAREALKEDPDFALARFLALDVEWTVWGNNEDAWLDPDKEAETRRKLEEVEAVADHLPEKERLSLRAMRASLEKQWDLAGGIRDRVAAQFPLDKEAIFLAGDIRYHSDSQSDAIPYFKRALQLDPGYRIAADHLAWSLTSLGRAADESDWLRAQVPLARSKEEKTALLWAFLSAGMEDDARRIQSDLAAMTGWKWIRPPLALFLIHHGRAPEAERALRDALVAAMAEDAEAGRPPGPYLNLRYALGMSLDAQGRFGDEPLTRVEPPPKGFDRRYSELQRRQWTAAARQEHAGLSLATQELQEQARFRSKDGGNWLEGPKSAIVTAMAGRLDLAGPTARQVLDGGAIRDPTSPERAFMVAIVAASESGSGAAPPELLAVAQHPQVWWRFPGSVVLGHYLRARGDCAGAITAYERARAVPWAWLVGEKPALFPFVLHSLASCYEVVGDLAKARERNAEMLRLWVNADPDIPLLAEAKATRARIVAAGAPAR